MTTMAGLAWKSAEADACDAKAECFDNAGEALKAVVEAADSSIRLTLDAAIQACAAGADRYRKRAGMLRG